MKNPPSSPAVEETIAGGLADFLRIGEALLTISHGKLYRATHRTFAEYCRQRWHLSRTAHLNNQVAETYKNVQVSCTKCR